MAKLYKVKPFFTDDRGKMYSLLKDDVKINSALLITCRKGAVRANHYHKKDGHYSYLIEGKMEYFFKANSGSKVRKIIVSKGDVIFTPPNEIHAMRFLEKSVFLALATETRSRKNYEEDTVRIELI
jgi:quercetin dioxygenase-like cupin family protein